MGMVSALRRRIEGAVEWVRGIYAVLHAMAELEEGTLSMGRPERPANLRELKASPPPRPRPVPAPSRLAGRKAIPAAAKVARAKSPRPPRPGTKVKRGQKHR
jgi:hypothetical protein